MTRPDRPSPPRPTLLRPGFLVPFACVVLIGLLLPFGTQRLVAAARKDAIDIRVPLAQLRDEAIPSFRLRHDVQIDTVGPEWLGTEESIILPVEPRPGADVPSAYRSSDPNRLPILFVTYYSDPEETIPHTPEVCYDQAGASLRDVARVPIELPGRDDGPHRAKRIIADREDGSTRVVLYVLYHNGRVLNDRQQVRLAMALPGDVHTYFAKVEAVAPVLPGVTEAEAEAVARRILEEAIPVVAREHMPPDEIVRGGAAAD